MAIDLSAYRASNAEQSRIADLLELVSPHGDSALDIGARDGYIAKKLASRFDQVTALDLEEPKIDCPGVITVRGDVTALAFPDDHFDTVLCSEVLEHIPPELLARACHEISRVARNSVVIGVPYRQDLRCGRTTCQACGKPNPPWGHVNSFDEERLRSLFPELVWQRATCVGSSSAQTNPVSMALLDFAGNPFGTWSQEEPCVVCGCNIGTPASRNLAQRAATRLAFLLNGLQGLFVKPHGNWIHVLLSKTGAITDSKVLAS